MEASVDPKTGDVNINEDVIVRYSACLGCYSSCGNRLKLSRDGGTLYSVGGNPYNPSCANPYLPFEAPLEDAYRSMSYANGYGNSTRGTSCGRGQATQDGYGQPDRITMPLKRAGARGEGKWKPISWDQLIKEVTEGGKLFADIGEDQEIEGFLSIHDTETPLNPDEPTLGPKSNQFVLLGGAATAAPPSADASRTASGRSTNMDTPPLEAAPQVRVRTFKLGPVPFAPTH